MEGRACGECRGSAPSEARELHTSGPLVRPGEPAHVYLYLGLDV